jgi:hypothetical protein
MDDIRGEDWELGIGKKFYLVPSRQSPPLCDKTLVKANYRRSFDFRINPFAKI